MTKQLSAILAAAALIGISASTFAEPMSVNETGPVLTAAQMSYDAQRPVPQGVAGRAGLQEIEAISYEVKTPSGGGKVDD